LVNGVRLRDEGEHFFTWDSTRQRSPNPRWRRFGSDRTVRTVLDVVAAFGRANPAPPRVGIADLSLPRGGDFGLEYGGRGHLPHQNGLDVEVLYPPGTTPTCTPSSPSDGRPVASRLDLGEDARTRSRAARG